MATNTTIPPEEKKVEMPTYDYQSPTGTYYGEQGNEPAALFQKMIADYVNKTDPQKQAEEDARIRRGREIWTGANLFTNVIANAINAYGTAKGAPNMTFNDAASQKMYDTWRDADKELKADRRAAQQRLEALQMQDAQMRAAGAEKRAGEVRNANDMNFRIALEQAQHERGRQEKEADQEKQWQHDDEVYQRNLADQRQNATTAFNRQAYLQKKGFEHQEELATQRAQQAKGYNKGTKTIRIGNTDFRAETEAEADANIAQVYGMVWRAYNRTQDNLHQQPFESKPENEYSFINAHINQLIASDPQFKSEYDAWADTHRRSVNTNNPTGDGGGNGQGSGQGNGFQL